MIDGQPIGLGQMMSELFSGGAFFAAGFLVALLLEWLVIHRVIIAKLNKDVRERKDQFVGIASHYMLTPVTIIQTAINRLQEKDSSLEPQERHLLYDAILMGQQRLWIIAEQLVLVSEIDQNELRLKVEVNDLSEMIGDAISAVDVFSRYKKVKIHMFDEPQQIREARFDHRRMKQAVIAVLDNAIKFSTEGGEIAVAINLESNIFTITVEDQGIGMPEEVLAHITEKFFRGSKMYTYDYEGIGLGLHIAQAIVRLHQGNISFRSKPQKGTVVSIEFPNI